MELKFLYIYIFCYNIGSFKTGGASIAKSDKDKTWKELKCKFHGHLAQFFHHEPFSQRKLMELPFQLLMAGEFHKLVKVLTDTV